VVKADQMRRLTNESATCWPSAKTQEAQTAPELGCNGDTPTGARRGSKGQMSWTRTEEATRPEWPIGIA
jgi:hypothetical protein